MNTTAEMGNLKGVERRINELYRLKYLDTMLLGFYVNYIDYNPKATRMDVVRSFITRMKLEDDHWQEKSSLVSLTRMTKLLEDELPHLRKD